MQQHITYNEFLPMILGRELLHEYGLSIEDVQKIGPLEPERKLFQINQCYYASNQAISPIYIRGVEPAFFGTAPSQVPGIFSLHYTTFVLHNHSI